MKAVQLSKYGSDKNLQDITMKIPAVGDNQVLIRNYAVAIEPYDIKFVNGLMGKKQATPLVPGSSVAGEVISVGSGVKDFKVGDRVAASPHLGTYAETVNVDQELLGRVSQKVSYPQAVSIVLSGQTGYQAIKSALKVQEGDKVLIHGGSGAVGFAAIQIAQQAGAAEIASTASGQGYNFLKKFDSSLKLFDYAKDDFSKKLSNYDKILDVTGNSQVISLSLEILKPSGKLVSIATRDLDQDPRAEFFSFSSQGKDLQALLDDVKQNNFKTHIADEKPFDANNLRDFYQRSNKGGVLGKLILTF